jgi:hypothetical protein
MRTEERGAATVSDSDGAATINLRERDLENESRE